MVNTATPFESKLPICLSSGESSKVHVCLWLKIHCCTKSDVHRKCICCSSEAVVCVAESFLENLCIHPLCAYFVLWSFLHCRSPYNHLKINKFVGFWTVPYFLSPSVMFVPWAVLNHMCVYQLMGLAVYNSIALDIHFPPCCYKKLLTPPIVPCDQNTPVGMATLGLDDLQQVMPVSVASWHATAETVVSLWPQFHNLITSIQFSGCYVKKSECLKGRIIAEDFRVFWIYILLGSATGDPRTKTCHVISLPSVHFDNLEKKFSVHL